MTSWYQDCKEVGVEWSKRSRQFRHECTYIHCCKQVSVAAFQASILWYLRPEIASSASPTDRGLPFYRGGYVTARVYSGPRRLAWKMAMSEVTHLLHEISLAAKNNSQWHAWFQAKRTSCACQSWAIVSFPSVWRDRTRWIRSIYIWSEMETDCQTRKGLFHHHPQTANLGSSLLSQSVNQSSFLWWVFIINSLSSNSTTSVLSRSQVSNTAVT